MAEAGRSAEVYFSEQAEAGDPRFVDKIAGTRLWLQTRPGSSRRWPSARAPTDSAPRCRRAGAWRSSGVCEYGVLARPKQTPFLLRYYPKAVAGKPDEVNAQRAEERGLGVRAGDRAHVRAGPGPVRPLPPGGSRGVGRRVLPHGRFRPLDLGSHRRRRRLGRLDAPRAGAVLGLLKDVVKTGRGHPGGEPLRGGPRVRQPGVHLAARRREADPEAVALFEEAVASRAVWCEGFPGFTAAAEGSVDGRPFSGKVTVGADGAVTVAVDDPVARPWLEEQLSSIAMHRLARRPAQTRAPVRRRRRGPPARPAPGLPGGPVRVELPGQGRPDPHGEPPDGQQNMTITVLDNAPERGRQIPAAQLPGPVLGRRHRRPRPRVETVQESWRASAATPARLPHVDDRLRHRVLGPEPHALGAAPGKP